VVSTREFAPAGEISMERQAQVAEVNVETGVKKSGLSIE
jgi:hypothetical protein